MAKIKSLSDVLIDQLKDLYNAESQLTKALPKMAKAASDDELKSAFKEHLEQTKQHMERIEQAMETLGGTPRGKTCKAMQGLVEEGDEIIKAEGDPAAKDAALICAAQKVEHYEIGSYGSVRTYAELLGHDEVAELLQSTLDEEEQTDERLTELAERINEEAMTGVEEEEESAET